jgi:hypothetical protein
MSTREHQGGAAAPQHWWRAGALRYAAGVAATALSLACVPRARPLPGTPVAPASLPRAELPAVARRIVFAWDYADQDVAARGEGVVRVAPPDSARLDVFLAGGFGGASAFLIGDSVRAPGGDLLRRVIPPPPLLWAGLGRLAVPAARDTVARVDGDTLRADIGRNPTFRASFAGGQLVGLERLDRGRVAETVVRTPDRRIVYRHAGARRTLTMTVTRVDTVPAFDSTTWQR